MRELLASGSLQTAMRSIAVGHALTQAAPTADRAGRWLAWTVMVALCALTGAALLLTAAYVLLADRLGSAVAFVSLGVFLCVIAAGLLMYRQRRIEQATDSAPTNPLDAANIAGLIAEAKVTAAAHPFLMIAAAFGVGMILAQPITQPDPEEETD